VKGLNIKQQQDLASKEDEGTDVHIHGVDERPLFYEKDGVETPVTITVVGTNSQRFRQIESRQRRRRLKPKDLTGEKVHEDAIEKVAFCTLRWEGVIDEHDNVIRCDFENAVMLYSALPHVYSQLLEAMGDHERFFGSSSSS